MMFLMNDAVIELDPRMGLPPIELRRFSAVSLEYMIKLGREAFAMSPRLQHTDPEKAKRLAMLIRSKAPDVNAALFVAPSERCKPDEVLFRVASLSVEVMASLKSRQNGGMLDAVSADREVWRRLAA
jgi:hypothetical protein